MYHCNADYTLHFWNTSVFIVDHEFKPLFS